MTIKICCAFAVATAVASVCRVEAFAPHASPQAVVQADELMVKANPLTSSPSSRSTTSASSYNREDDLSSPSTAAVLSTTAFHKPRTKRKSHKKMQRPTAHSRVIKKKAPSNSRKTPLLTREEEAQHSNDIRLFRAAVKLRDELVRFENGVYIHPTESEWAAACGTSVRNLRRMLSTGQEARTALIAANAGLVVSIAKKHHAGLKYATEAGGGVGTVLTIEDMIQEGNLGLMEAAERFDPAKGFRFSTYATWWVRQRILRSISDSSRIIRLPAHVHGQLQKIRKAKVEMKRETGREPSIQELAHYMEITEEKLRLYTESSRNVVSLERPLTTSSFKDDRRTLGDTLASDAPTPVEDAEVDSMRRDIRSVMETELAGTERDVLVHRFGLDGESPQSVADTAGILGISVDRVRTAEARALNKLRHPQRNYKLKEYIQHENNSADVALGSSTTDRLEETFANSPTQTNPDRMWFF